MSKDHHPPELAIENSRSPRLWGDSYRTPSLPEYNGYFTHSSSPPRSSSPPSTPYSSRRDSGYACILSSPDVLVDPLYKHAVDIWSRPALSSKSFFSSSYLRNHDHYYASDHGFQKDAFLDSDGCRNDMPSDSEEEMEDIGSDGSYRTTFFRISAERGLWRSDPLAPPTLQERKSVPSFSRVQSPLPLTTRTVSEPAPSSVSQITDFYPEKENERTTELLSPATADTGMQSTPLAVPIETKPNCFIADAEGSEFDENIEPDVPGVTSSPLPPSSPPLSPLSRSISIISRSSSPLPFAFEESSSPLSELPDDYDSDGSHLWGEDFTSSNALGMEITERTITPSLKIQDDTNVSELTSELQASCHDLAQTEQSLSPSKPQPSPLPSSEGPVILSPTRVSTISNIIVTTTLSCEDMAPVDSDDFSSTLDPLATSSSTDVEKGGDPEVEMMPNSFVPESSGPESSGPSTGTPDSDPSNRYPSPNLEKSSALKDKNGVMHRVSSAIKLSTSRASSHRASHWGGKEQNSEGRAKKQERVDARSSNVKGKKVDGKKRMKLDDEEDVENDGSSSITGARRKRLKRFDGDAVTSRSTKRITKRRVRPTSMYEEDEVEEPLDPEARELHATVCGLVIETMATSRASSLPVSSIFKLVMNSQPYLKSQRSEQDWLQIFERVLRDGAAGRGSGVFGKVESSGKDGSDQPLEAQWFYVPDRDEDQERAALIRSMMPRPGKRTETMKYKQYYWRPLGKISKWDPEDAL